MKTVKLDRFTLLGIVKHNMATHVSMYEESITDYIALVGKITAENAKLAKTGVLESIAKIKAVPNAPVSYKDSYVRAIRMLELSVDDTIELDESTFSQLVLDEWVWKNPFLTSVGMYKTK